MAAIPLPSASDSGNDLAIAKQSGFLYIARHGAGLSSVYLVSFNRLDEVGGATRPLAVEGAQGLIDLLEQLGIDFKMAVVRGALEDILRLGSATIPDLLLSEERLTQNGMVPSNI